MKDKLIRGTAKDGQVRFIAASTTELVNKAMELHNCSATSGAALGRLLTGASLMGSMLKNDKDTLTLQMNGGGPAKSLVATSYSDGSVKGYISNPFVDIPLNSKGKLDVGGAVGKSGTLYVIKDMGLKDPYIGQVPIYTGEIAEDLAYYFTVSEQTPSAVALGVLVDTDLSAKAAGGFIIQMMPDADPLLADLITYRLEDIPSVTDMLSKGMTIEQVIEEVFDGMDAKIMEELTPIYTCNCSKERVERAFLSIGEKDLRELYEDGKTEELKCHFCNTTYKFTHEEIGELLKSLTQE